MNDEIKRQMMISGRRHRVLAASDESVKELKKELGIKGKDQGGKAYPMRISGSTGFTIYPSKREIEEIRDPGRRYEARLAKNEMKKLRARDKAGLFPQHQMAMGIPADNAPAGYWRHQIHGYSQEDRMMKALKPEEYGKDMLGTMRPYRQDAAARKDRNVSMQPYREPVSKRAARTIQRGLIDAYYRPGGIGYHIAKRHYEETEPHNNKKRRTQTP